MKTTATPRLLRLLSCNIHAGSSTQRYRDYLSHSLLHVLPHGKRDNLESIGLMSSQFDLVGLQESDPGSLRSGFTNQTHYLAERGGFPYWSHQPNRKMGGIASSANGMLSRHRPTAVLDYALPGRVGGRGVLLARFGEGDASLTVAIAHLSLGAQSRASQMDFLAELLGDAKHVVLMGDFNCGHDAPEVQRLFKRTRLEPPEHTPPTFPSWKPVRALDHILCSKSLHPGVMRAMPVGRSDHLAVEVQVQIPDQVESIQPSSAKAKA